MVHASQGYIMRSCLKNGKKMSFLTVNMGFFGLLQTSNCVLLATVNAFSVFKTGIKMGTKYKLCWYHKVYLIMMVFEEIRSEIRLSFLMVGGGACL